MSTSNIILLVGGFTLGLLFYSVLDSLIKYLKSRKIVTDSSNQFSEIIKNLKTGTTNFVSRVNDTIFIDTNLKDWKEVNIIYLLDKKMVCIFKDNKCLYTTDIIDETLRENLISEISDKYKEEIEDVIEIMGTKISKSEFESRVNEFKSSTSMDNINFNFETEEQDSEIDQIVFDNEGKYDLDEILDKLTKNNYNRDTLTKEEIDFLDHKSKEK